MRYYTSARFSFTMFQPSEAELSRLSSSRIRDASDLSILNHFRAEDLADGRKISRVGYVNMSGNQKRKIRVKFSIFVKLVIC